eukprot:scaffold15922_cov15-Tisochrysis_lutea.AAC.2
MGLSARRCKLLSTKARLLDTAAMACSAVFVRIHNKVQPTLPPEEREREGYIAVPAYQGSLAEARNVQPARSPKSPPWFAYPKVR